MLEEFLDDNKQHLADDFVAVKINVSEMKHGSDVGRRLRGESGGIPWIIILDAEGNALVTSDGPDGNIGYPMSNSEIDYFLEMLRVARPELDAEKGSAIRQSLVDYAKQRTESS